MQVFLSIDKNRRDSINYFFGGIYMLNTGKDFISYIGGFSTFKKGKEMFCESKPIFVNDCYCSMNVSKQEIEQRETLQMAYLDKLNRLMTCEVKTDMCFDVIERMLEFRLEHCGTIEMTDGTLLYYHVQQMIRNLKAFLLDIIEMRDDNPFEIIPYNCVTTHSLAYRQGLGINYHGGLYLQHNRMYLGAVLEKEIYRALTRWLQSLTTIKEYHICDKDLEAYQALLRKEVAYCSCESIDHRFYPIVHVRSDDYEEPLFNRDYNFTNYKGEKYLAVDASCFGC